MNINILENNQIYVTCFHDQDKIICAGCKKAYDEYVAKRTKYIKGEE